ncbi:N(5)-(carboxyethyl)ornithine synthase [Sporosarcina sp. GW1-11]|uniref:N(5)-(carboxyethyl)ornithine synthase n=1 Tax=Sporosarcina sp. GW1-11 TaxID=2899126 RepID=UPI00294C3C94|nr:N(5)-(carboxyethyl)ornithine synthase [Sporosarcina sp. GW1-11]MDV6377887.1 N(5)-(carboxyethyl)ornithine synthase [Sporosarcina sp. GW1-11]
MYTIGFVISHKNNEKRRALVPKDLTQIKCVDKLYFEEGYGDVLGYSDEEYTAHGVHIVSRDRVLECDAIVDVKLGDADFFDKIPPGKLLIGWAHAVQDIKFTDAALAGNHTVMAWEEMFDGGRYIFYRNREIAGEAAIIQSYQYCGKMPYETKVAVLGNGHTTKGVLRILHGLGADVDVYGRKLESLFRKNMYNYDVLVNCVMWDTSRTDRIIYKEDLKKLKKGAMIVDVSCDPNLEIETSRPSTIDDPVYTVDGIIHYAVDNTPAMFPHTVTNMLSEVFSEMVDMLSEGNWTDMVRQAIVIEKGNILDKNITEFREARGLFVK